MPMHDWTRVSAGTFHAFHNSWISELQKALNAGLLPPPYYALGEQQATDIRPDVFALHDLGEIDAPAPESLDAETDAGLIAVADAPPRVRVTLESPDNLVFLQRR